MRINSVSGFGSYYTSNSTKKTGMPSFEGSAYIRYVNHGEEKGDKDYFERKDGINLGHQILMIGRRPLEPMDGAAPPDYILKGTIYSCNVNEYVPDEEYDNNCAVMDYIVSVQVPKTMESLDYITKHRSLKNLFGFRDCLQADKDYYERLSGDVEGYVERYYDAEPRMRYTPLWCEDKDIEERKKAGEEFLKTHTKEEVIEIERERIESRCKELPELLDEANRRIYGHLLKLINAGLEDKELYREGYSTEEITKYRKIAEESKKS